MNGSEIDVPVSALSVVVRLCILTSPPGSIYTVQLILYGVYSLVPVQRQRATKRNITSERRPVTNMC